MAKIKKVLRCYSCGAVLQTEDKNLPGYITKDVLEITNPKIPYCDECYRKILNISSVETKSTKDSDIINILDDATASDAIIVWVIDLPNFCGIMHKEIAEKVKHLKVFVVATKRNCYSNKIPNAVFEEYIANAFKKVGIIPSIIRIVDEKLAALSTSASILNEFDQIRQGHDIYIFGAPFSGKSVIVAKILKGFVNNSQWIIRSEVYPDTDAKVLEIPLSNSSFLYDLPDLSNDYSLYSKVEKDVLKLLVPHSELEIYYRNLTLNDVLIIGCLGRFELHVGKTTKIRFELNQGLEFKKVTSSNADDFFRVNFSKRNFRPVSDYYSLFTDFDIYDVTMPNDNKMHDITICGLATFSFVATGQVFRVTLPKGVSLMEGYAKVK